jgi:PleD family two-component response regulator
VNPNLKIPVVDDFATMRRLIRNLLQGLCFTNVSEADDGKTAWPMLASGYVIKPFTAETLKAKLDKILAAMLPSA